MFEENIQQDAPEFLHCLLMYVQEASKQIFKLQDILSPPRPLLMPADREDKMEDDQDSKSDKSDAPSTSSGYDSGMTLWSKMEKKHRQNSHPIILFPMSEGVSEVTERANE